MHQARDQLTATFHRWAAVHLQENDHLKSRDNLASVLGNLGCLIHQELPRVPLRDFNESHIELLKRKLIVGGWRTVRGLEAKPYAADVINKRLKNLRDFLHWCASHGLVDANMPYRVAALVKPAKAGRKRCKPAKKVLPIAWEIVQQLKPYCTPTLWSIIELQYWSAMRPGEVTGMTWGEIDTREPVWVYQPAEHKTSYLGEVHPILLGPRSQQVLVAYRQIDDNERPLFGRRIHQTERQRLHRGVREPLLPHWRSYDPKPFDTQYYWEVLQGAIKTANNYGEAIPKWSPNQLRHTAATEINAQFDAPTAAAILGNTEAVVVRYIELAYEKAKNHVLEAR